MKSWSSVVLSMGLLLPGCSSIDGAEDGPTVLASPSTLDSSCQVYRQWYGLVPVQSWVGVLKCGESSLTLSTPLNLLSLVHLRDSREALEFVRFFTSPETWYLFQLDGFLEVSKDVDSDSWVADLAAEMERQGIDISVKLEESNQTVGRRQVERQFLVERCVVALDQNVYRIQEEVREDGHYHLQSKQAVLEDISSLGFVHSKP